MIFEKVKWPILILQNWKRVYTKASSKIKRLGRSVYACLGKPRSLHSQWLMKSQLMEQVPARKIKTDMERWSLRIFKGFRTQTTNWRIVFVKMVMEWWMLIFFLTEFSRQSFSRVSYTCSGDYSVYDGRCTYTHLLHAHFSAHCACTITFAHLHACAHARMAQGCQRGSLHMSFLPISPSLAPVSPPILAVPWRSLRDHSWLWRPHVLAVLTCPKSAGHAHLRASEKFGCLAKFALNTDCAQKPTPQCRHTFRAILLTRSKCVEEKKYPRQK